MTPCVKEHIRNHSLLLAMSKPNQREHRRRLSAFYISLEEVLALLENLKRH